MAEQSVRLTNGFGSEDLLAVARTKLIDVIIASLLEGQDIIPPILTFDPLNGAKLDLDAVYNKAISDPVPMVKFLEGNGSTDYLKENKNFFKEEDVVVAIANAVGSEPELIELQSSSYKVGEGSSLYWQYVLVQQFKLNPFTNVFTQPQLLGYSLGDVVTIKGELVENFRYQKIYLNPNDRRNHIRKVYIKLPLMVTDTLGDFVFDGVKELFLYEEESYQKEYYSYFGSLYGPLEYLYPYEWRSAPIAEYSVNIGDQQFWYIFDMQNAPAPLIMYGSSFRRNESYFPTIIIFDKRSDKYCNEIGGRGQVDYNNIIEPLGLTADSLTAQCKKQFSEIWDNREKNQSIRLDQCFLHISVDANTNTQVGKKYIYHLLEDTANVSIGSIGNGGMAKIDRFNTAQSFAVSNKVGKMLDGYDIIFGKSYVPSNGGFKSYYVNTIKARKKLDDNNYKEVYCYRTSISGDGSDPFSGNERFSLDRLILDRHFNINERKELYLECMAFVMDLGVTQKTAWYKDPDLWEFVGLVLTVVSFGTAGSALNLLIRGLLSVGVQFGVDYALREIGGDLGRAIAIVVAVSASLYATRQGSGELFSSLTVDEVFASMEAVMSVGQADLQVRSDLLAEDIERYNDYMSAEEAKLKDLRAEIGYIHENSDSLPAILEVAIMPYEYPDDYYARTLNSSPSSTVIDSQAYFFDAQLSLPKLQLIDNYEIEGNEYG